VQISDIVARRHQAASRLLVGKKARRRRSEQVRHLILKDMQVLAKGTEHFVNASADVADGEARYQPDPVFCAQFPSSTSEVRQGSCQGADNSDAGGNDYANAKWYFTINGQPFPTLRMTSADGEIWRLINASGSLSYDLQLLDDATQKPMVMQLLAVDGVSIHLPQDTSMSTMVQLAGARFKVVPCPAAPSIGFQSLPICINELVMMPGSRTELWVAYRDTAGRLAGPPAGATGTFKWSASLWAAAMPGQPSTSPRLSSRRAVGAIARASPSTSLETRWPPCSRTVSSPRRFLMRRPRRCRLVVNRSLRGIAGGSSSDSRT
jgi:hypothetical protein